MSVIEIRSATGSLLMLIARLLLSTVVLSCLQAAAAACEHCRAAAMAAATAAAAQTNPTDLAVAAIQTAGKELRQSISARKLLCAETEKLAAARDSMLRELQTVDAQLKAIKTHVQGDQYPLVLGELVIRDETTAHRAASELFARHDSLTAAVNQLTGELEAGEHQRLQLNQRIHQYETDILLAQHRAVRIRATSVPQTSARPLDALRFTAPSGSAQSQRQQRLQEFLRNGVVQ
jgi:hypothetical protein